MPEEPKTLLERLGTLWDDPYLSNGFVVGAIVGFILVVIVGAVIYWLSRRHRCRGVLVQGEDGDLFITVNAMREFVVLVLTEFTEASLSSVSLLEKADALLLNIALHAQPDTEIPPLRELLKERIMTGAKEKMGIDRPLKVNVSIESLSAKERRGGRPLRRPVRRPAVPLPDEGPADGAREGPSIPIVREQVPLE